VQYNYNECAGINTRFRITDKMIMMFFNMIIGIKLVLMSEGFVSGATTNTRAANTKLRILACNKQWSLCF
jgi:hypothetical protein